MVETMNEGPTAKVSLGRLLAIEQSRVGDNTDSNIELFV